MKNVQVAQFLLSAKAVFLRPEDPFTWASGIKSPIYCDNRQLISNVEARRYITQCFVDLIQQYYPEVDVIAGTSTAGIPWAAWVAEKLNKPMVYVRSAPKDHGRENLVEGKLEKDQTVIVIEDLISTGNSSYKVVEALQKQETKVLGLLAIFSYEFEKANKLFATHNLSFHTLTSFQTLLEVASSQSIINENEKNQILNWRKQFI